MVVVGRVRPHAEDQRARPAATTGRTATRSCWPAAASAAGTVYGASDKHAAYVKDRPVSPEDFAATVLHAFGLPPDALILDPFHRPVRISEGTPLASLFG